MQCNPMMIERWTNKRSSKAWWSYLIHTFEHDFSKKIYNEVNLSYFSPVSVHLKMLLI